MLVVYKDKWNEQFNDELIHKRSVLSKVVRWLKQDWMKMLLYIMPINTFLVKQKVCVISKIVLLDEGN